jgi:SAM-dependent methyltransferase
MENASEHYTGTRGDEYFEWQRQIGESGGHINARKFSRLIKPGDTVLDFGCGSGAMLASLVCGRRIGVEANPVARERAAELGVEMYATLGEVADRCVDVLVSNHALEHVLNPLGELKAMRRVVSGTLALCLPIDDWRTERHFVSGDQNQHLFTWTPLLIGNLLVEAGFSVLSANILVHAWPMSWKWLDKRLPVRAFDAVCHLAAVRRRRRQVFVVAR